jgi:hypothetical protein
MVAVMVTVTVARPRYILCWQQQGTSGLSTVLWHWFETFKLPEFIYFHSQRPGGMMGNEQPPTMKAFLFIQKMLHKYI